MTSSVPTQKKRIHNPALFDRDTYAKGIERERQLAGVIVTAAIFSPCGGYLVCSSDSGRLAIWEIAPLMAESFFSGHDGWEADVSPNMSFMAAASCINSLEFSGSGSKAVLLCGGDNSLFGWPWRDILKALEGGYAPSKPPPVQIHCPQTLTGRGGCLPWAEINDISASPVLPGLVLCASGDSNAYEWDLESMSEVPLRTCKGHTAYLHALQLVPLAGISVTGSEDGSVGIWDRRGPGAVGFIRPVQEALDAGLVRVPSGGRLTSWVSGVETDAKGEFVACAGGLSGEVGGRGGGGRGWHSGGWLGLWHLPTRTVTSASTAPAQVQCMVSNEDGLILGGAEKYVSYHSWSQLELRTRTPATAKSVYALAVNSAGPHAGAHR